jgi:hypothetical protein
VACRESGLPPLRERVEQKFYVLPQKQSLAFALLRRTCRAEKDYAVGQVNSLYFDTPDLDQHERSDSGEHAKDKVRIRWYGEDHDPHRTGDESRATGSNGAALSGAHGADASLDDHGVIRVWLELKSRRGFASTKQRLPLEVSTAALASSALSRGIVPSATLMETMAAFGFFARRRLCPVVAISYWRYRFVEPETGFRISIDSHIRSSLVMPGLGKGERALELPGAVVEVKGPVFDVPHALRPIAYIGTSWTRYSKYSSSLDGHEATAGSVSRLWPSGMMDAEPGPLTWVRKSPGFDTTDEGERDWSRPAPRFVEEYEAE